MTRALSMTCTEPVEVAMRFYLTQFELINILSIGIIVYNSIYLQYLKN
jgi:hypothetical protein